MKLLKHQQGFSVIEFLIASLLTVSVVSSTTLAIAISNDITNKNQIAEHIQTAANSIFQLSRAYNCGMAVAGNVSQNQTIISNCKVPHSNDIIFSGKAEFIWPDSSVRFISNTSNKGFKSTLYTVWQPSYVLTRNSYSDSCWGPTSGNSNAGQILNGSQLNSIDAYQPSKVTRYLILEYTDKGINYFSVFTDTQSIDT